MYTCNKKAENIKDRCTKIETEEVSAAASASSTYPTLRECIMNCNTEEEQEKLDALKEKVQIKNIVEYIRPKLIKTFNILKDIPVLHYDGKLNANSILNSNEYKVLYSTLNLQTIWEKIPNQFLIDLITSLNGIIGSDINIASVEEVSSKRMIIYDTANKYEYNFLEEEYITEFNTEITNFIRKPNIYLVKNILIYPHIGAGHHTMMLIKKEIVDKELTLHVFIYDPYSNLSHLKSLEISKNLEEFINTQFKDKYKYTFFNLSYMYGIQDNELSDPVQFIKSVSSLYDKHLSSIMIILEEIFHNAEGLYTYIESIFTSKEIPEEFPETLKSYNFDDPESTMDNLFFKYIMAHFLGDLSEHHYLRPTIETYIKELYEYKSVAMKLFNLFKNKITDQTDDRFSKLKKYIKKSRTFVNIQNKYYGIDYFWGYCYMWSYYTFILILNNPTINSYDIVKSVCYQSSNLEKMKDIYEEIKLNVEEIKSSSNVQLFDYDNLDKKYKILDDREKAFYSNKKNDSIIDRNKLIYIKITNFILLNCYYNRIDNKYLLNRIIQGCPNDECIAEMIPAKVNEILDKLTFNNNPLTKELILDTIKTGINILDLNANILANQVYKEKLKKYQRLLQEIRAIRASRVDLL